MATDYASHFAGYKYIEAESTSLKFGFDIDHTISCEPTIFKALMEALMEAGHQVYVLTALQLDEAGKPDFHDASERPDQLKNMGLKKGTHYTDVVIAKGETSSDVADEKAKQASRLGLSLFTDDKPINVERVSKVCRSLMVWPSPTDDW